MCQTSALCSCRTTELASWTRWNTLHIFIFNDILKTIWIRQLNDSAFNKIIKHILKTLLGWFLFLLFLSIAHNKNTYLIWNLTEESECCWGGSVVYKQVGEVIILISMQLFLLYAGQDHQAARRASLPNSSSNPKILTMKTFKVGIQRIGLVSLLPHLCSKMKLCQPGRAKGDWAVSSSMC